MTAPIVLFARDLVARERCVQGRIAGGFHVVAKQLAHLA